jgi:uncharacterized membrane protein YjgN (DUF898 family)
MSDIVGSSGFVAWFYAVTWKSLQQFGTKAYGRYLLHSIGVFFIILGLIPLIRLMHPVLIFGGIALLLGGVVIFIAPLSTPQ